MAERRDTYRKKPVHEPQITDTMGKLPPHDTMLEETVLGELMLEKDAYVVVSDLLVEDSFYEPRNKKIFKAISTLGANQRPIDMMTVTDQLRQDGTLDEVGGAVFITDLTSRVVSAAHVEYHARIIAQKYLARRLISFASEIERGAFDEGYDVDDLMQDAEAKLFEISQTQLKREVTQVDPVFTEALKQMRLAGQSESGLSGLQTGYPDLDKMTAGWQNSDLIIIAARPAMGKTAFVLSMAKNMAIDLDIPTAVFSLEMANVQLVKRIISNLGNVEGDRIKSGDLSADQWRYLDERLHSAYGAPLYLDETPGLSVSELRTKARRLVREHGVRIIMIDYLQLMSAGNSKLGSREQEVSTISRSLKALAKELNIPIIALSQLNRSTETREDKRPVLSDLRESGAIEQDADIVCFIHRPDYYNRSGVDAAGNNIRGKAELIVAKHRNGATGDVPMRFVSKYARFEPWDDNYQTVQNVLDEAGQGETRTMDSGFMSRRAASQGGFGATPIDDSNLPMPDFGMPGSGPLPGAGQMPDLSPDPGEKLPF